MKRFDDSTAFTPIVTKENENSSFDLNKLLQILPKLNLGNFFRSNDAPAPAPVPTPNLQNALDRQNYIETQRRLNEHYATIQRIRENKDTTQ